MRRTANGGDDYDEVRLVEAPESYQPAVVQNRSPSEKVTWAITYRPYIPRGAPRTPSSFRPS